MDEDFDLDGIILAVAGIIAAIVIFIAIIGAVQKSFKSAPKVKESAASQILSEQKRRTAEIENERDRLMDSRRQQFKARQKK